MAAHATGVWAPTDEHHCRRAVGLRPKSADARLDLARALLTADDPAGAVEQSSIALALQPDLRDAAWLLAAVLQRYELNAEIEISPRGLTAALAFPDVDGQALGNAAIVFLKEQAPLSHVMASGRTDGWESAAACLLRKSGRKLLQDRLFHAALANSVNTDPDLECLLTAFRKHLLFAPQALSARPVYEFACVLIRQCRNNGYVFAVTEKERDVLDILECDADAAVRGDAAHAGNLILTALYRPLPEVAGQACAEYGYARAAPRALRPVLRQVHEAQKTEADIAERISRLTPLTQGVSRTVAAQYETAPYPRWLSLQTPEPGSAARLLCDHFSETELRSIEGPSDVLIAGAGTCRQAISSAIGYGPDARVLAVDLSLKSLAYGARMAGLLGVDNLRVAQADILRLGETSERFDVIECAGVLHHMDDPYAGWHSLTTCLRPGGLMLIGLYSAVSRRVIAALADDPDWPGPEADDDALRVYRSALMGRGSNEPGSSLTRSIDFYDTNGFRDLALHVNERHCTIPEIADFMDRHGLRFHGFVLPPETRDAYRGEYPEDVPAGTFEHWWAFEQANPRTFDGMYMFWCRRPETEI